MTDELQLRYPIGKLSEQSLTGKEPYAEAIKQTHLREIQYLPVILESTVQNLDAHQLETEYRPGGWTIQQLVHHIADSHMNAYMRFKLALTEENPTIKPYNEAAWANLSDSRNIPVNISLTLVHALHARWHELLKGMNEQEWHRTFFHPEQQRQISLWSTLATYAWHGKHHVAHITSLRERMGWS